MRSGLEAARLSALAAFSRHWAEHNIDGLLELMTEDCLYLASVGPEPGKTFRGQEQVRVGILEMFRYDLTERSEVYNLFIAGDRAAWEWKYYHTDSDGNEILTHGCDLFEFTGDKISCKQAFRKVLSS